MSRLIFGSIFILSACGGGESSLSLPSNRVLPPITMNEFSSQYGLAHVKLASVYESGWTGRDVHVGVVDSGIDSVHHEFENRIRDGLDWYNASKGRIDPHGHGTHVASILGAADNQRGMQGIAPEVQLYPYRLLSSNGTVYNSVIRRAIPAILRDAQQGGLSIINNSWGSRVEIDDVSKGDIELAFGTEITAWQAAVDNGAVIVWAAGNDRDHEVSIRAGLPYYFPRLQKGWLAVVAADKQLREPYYTNRCGLALAWCLTAPGGGDNERQTGIWAAQSGGGYTRKSGTSMAAPHVSGGLAVLMQAFPRLTPQELAQRLLKTAHYQGLRTTSGCTIQRCSKAQMEAVFGQGLMDLEAALQPISTLSFQHAGQNYDPNMQLYLDPLIYDAVRQALSTHHLLAIDGFDGARFAIPTSVFLHRQKPIFPSPAHASKSLMPISLMSISGGRGGFNNFGGNNFGTHNFGKNNLRQNNLEAGNLETGNLQHVFSMRTASPLLTRRPEHLTDISFLPAQFWYVLDHQRKRQGWTTRFGYDAKRQAVSFTYRHIYTDWHVWAGFGLGRERSRWLNSYGSGMLGLSDGRQVWRYGGVRRQLSQFGLQSEWLSGLSQTTRPAHSMYLIKQSAARVESWQVKLDYQLTDQTWLALTMQQPLRVRGGEIEIADPLSDKSARYNLGSSPSVMRYGLYWHHALASDLSVSAHYNFDQASPSTYTPTQPLNYGGIDLKFTF